MLIFLDSANIDEVKKANDLGVISGVTTNPSLIAKEGRDFVQVVREIAGIVDGPISAEVIGTQAQQMVEEALELVKIHPNIVIKVPMTGEGLQATKELAAKGIKTNVTLVFSANQALLAARAGATYVSPFVGRLEDINQDGLQIVDDIVSVFSLHQIETKIIAASIRTPVHALESARLGADIATIPFKVIMQMLEHPMTTSGIQKFQEDWDKVYKK